MVEIFQKDSGSVVVLTALLMFFFLAGLMFVIDLGIFILEKNRLSNAVDAAALAGVQELPFDPNKSQIVAFDYLNRNINNPEENHISFSPDKKEIEVYAKKTVYFALVSIFGFTSAQIEARAKARTDVVSAVSGTLPLAVEKQNFIFGKQYMLKYGPGMGRGSYYHGNFGALALGGSGAKNYRQNLSEGYKGILRIGDWVLTEPGNMAGPTVEGIRARLESCTHPNCSYDNIVRGCKKLAIVPIVDSLEVSGKKEVKIIGFGAFFIEGTTRRGADSYIVGRFIRYAAQGEMGEGEDFGLKAAKLIE